jgi:gliding motility-associated-like protein
MKKNFTQAVFACLSFLFFNTPAFAVGGSNWTSKFEAQKVFIENKGQFKIKASEGFDQMVQYAYDGHEQNFYFTKSGVVLELVEIKKPKQKENEEREMKERMKKGITPEQHAKMEEEEHRMIIKKDELRAQWIGANPNVKIVAEDKISATFSYCFKDKEGKLVNANQIPGYQKLTYKDLYPNIDVVYEMHPDRGIKYSVIVHPGGDISKVKLQYSKNAHLLSDGTIKTKSRLGDFIDHAPATFYADDKTSIASSYLVKNNVISFAIPNYDASKTIVIDPWTQSPSFNTAWHTVWECDKDAAGNVYIIGGIMPMQLLKYNSAGTLQWTYNTPYDTSNSWLGTFAVDNAGNSYVTAGSVARIQKIDAAGGLVRDNPNPSGSILNNQEFWSISFNCDQTQLVIGGTDGTSSTLGPFIFNMDLTTLSELNSIQVHGSGSLFGFPPRIQEVRAITACGNSNYAFLTHDSIGYVHQGFTQCLPPGSVFPFHVDNGLALGYKCEDFRTDNSGICALKSFGGFIFVHKGNQVQKRNLYTGAILATATIPGGAFPNSGFGGGNYVSNSGIDIDSCGNVYCGSTNAVVKFNINLTQLSTFPTAFNVYDINITSTGDLIAVGSTGTSTSGARTGYVQSFAAGACKVISIVCCDAGICPHAAVCTSDAPFNLTPTTAGGTWSGIGITNTTNGTFSPAVAGVGTFTIYHTLPCGRDSVTVTVNNCSAVSVCRNTNGTLTVSGGTPPYTWQTWDSVGRTCQGGIVIAGFCAGGTWVNTYGWSTFSTGAATTVTPPAGADTLRVIDNAGTTVTSYNIATLPPCTASCNLVVTAGPKRNVSCLGGNNGSAHVTTTGGVAPLTYTWSAGGSTVDSAYNLTSGTYTVTVRDANSCTGTATFAITQPASSVSVGVAINRPAACGNNTGKIKLSVSGGTPAYSYTWSPNVSTADSAINLAAGTYHVTVTDQGSCTSTLTIVVASAPAVTVTAGVKKDVSCFGGNNGSAHVNVSGGTSPFTYTWSPNVSTVDSAINLAAGTYTVTVRDVNGCTGTASFSISQPAAAISTAPALTPATCSGNTGKIVLHAAGGTPAYTYTWSPNVSTVDSALNLAAGTYNVTITDSKGCTFTTSAIVAPPTGITVTAGVKTDVRCFGGSTGTAHVNVTGGTLPYTYSWSPNVSTVDSAINLATGTYTVTVRDANSCSGTATFNISQPAAALAVTSTATAATCNSSNGKIVLHVTGGTPAYSYTWSPNVSTVDSALNLAANTYNVTVTDARGCTVTTSVAVTLTPAVVVSAGVKTDVSCFGGNNGTAHVTTTGGATPYTYTWSPNVSTVDSAVNLTAGTYTVTVRDANNCSGTASFTIAQPAAALAATNTTVPATCGSNDGKVFIHVTGGTPSYTYVWSPNVSTVDSAINVSIGTYSVTITDSKGCTLTTSASVASSTGFSVSTGAQLNVNCFGGNNGSAHVIAAGGASPYTYSWSPNVSTVDSAINLIAGTYSVTVRDAGTCSGIVTFNITEPATALSATAVTTQGSCGVNNGKIVVTATGGTPAYTYLWTGGSTRDSLINLGAGTYTVTVTDSKGCTTTLSRTVTVSPAVVVSAVIINDVSCSGGANGAVHLTIGSGTGPFSYTWSPNVSTADSAVALAAGSYSVTVRDANGCSALIDTAVKQPTALATIMTSQNTDCGVRNGWAHAAVTGGAGPYTYVWNATSTTDSATGLGAGTYRVTITDANGCIKIDSAVVGANSAPSAPTITGGPLTFCLGDSVVLTSSATTGNTWSTGATTQSITVYNSGTITVTQTAGACTSPPSAAVTITVNPIPSTPSISASGPLTFCPGGSVVLTSSAATGNVWSTTATTQSITATTSGSYTVSVILNGCPSLPSAPVSVTVLSNPTPHITTTASAVCPGDLVTLDVTTPGATSYAWDGNTAAASIQVPAGTYSATVTVNGCQGTDVITIGLLPVLGQLVIKDSFLVCIGDTVKLDATTAEATSYHWTSTTGLNETTPIVYIEADTAHPDGMYYVDVSNSCGALGDTIQIVFQACDCKMVMGNAFSPNGDGKNETYGPNFLCREPKALTMRIYNRWGQTVFETSDLVGRWDGTFKGEAQPDGVYTYTIEFTGIERHKEKTFKMVGAVTLLR